MEKLEDLRKRLKQARQELGVTQMKASFDIGISLISIRTLEQGGRVGDIVQAKVEQWLRANER
jgi:DNA-binding XRE family transcriptional regulator